MKPRWFYAFGLLLACSTPAAPSAAPVSAGDPPVAAPEVAPTTVPTVEPASPEAPMSDLATVDWDMSLEDGGKSLHIRYTVTSRADHRVYITDLLPVSGKGGFLWGEKSIIVMNDEAPDTALFVRARVASEAPVIVPLDPGARALDPGGTATGEAVVPWPLQGWHYHGTVAPLRPNLKQAALEIGVLDGDIGWTNLPLADGRQMTVSNPADPIGIIRGAVKPLP